MQKQITEETGEDIYFFFRTNYDAKNIERLKQESLPNTSIAIAERYNTMSAEKKETLRALCEKYPDVLIGVWNPLTPGPLMAKEQQEAWDLGVRGIWCDNDLIGLLEFENSH